MAADFPIGKVFVASCYDAKNRDAQFLPFEFKGLSKGCHKEQEEDNNNSLNLLLLANACTIGIMMHVFI